MRTLLGDRIAFLFHGGCPCRIYSPVGERVVWDALGDQLPPEQLSFVRRHADEQEIDPLTAIHQLALLPENVILKLHEECLRLQSEWLCSQKGNLHYRSFSGNDCFHDKPGMSHQVEPLQIIAECLRKSPDLSWCREQLQSSRRHPLVLIGRLATTSYELNGPLRQIVLALRREEDSFESLRLRRVAPEQTLIAVIYTLRSTGSAASPRPQEPSQRSPVISRVVTEPRHRIPQSLPPTRSPQSATGKRVVCAPPSAVQTPLPPQSTRGPLFSTRANATPAPPHSNIQGNRARPTVPAPSSSGLKQIDSTVTTPAMPAVRSKRPPTAQNEHAIEARALQAWMRAVDAPASRVKALAIAQKAARHFPANPRILFYLGCILGLTGNTPGAEATLQLVLEIDPEHSEAGRELKKLTTNEAAQDYESKKERSSLLMRFGRRKHG